MGRKESNQTNKCVYFQELLPYMDLHIEFTRSSFACWAILNALSWSADFFFKINFFTNIFQECHQSVKQFLLKQCAIVTTSIWH